MGHAVGQNGVHPRVEQEDLQVTAGGGVALADSGDVGGNLLADGGHGVGNLLGALLAEAGKVKMDDGVVVMAHGKYLTGMGNGRKKAR